MAEDFNDSKTMKKKIVGFTAGNFDLLHPGYIYTFEDAKKHCDHFIVFLQKITHSNTYLLAVDCDSRLYSKLPLNGDVKQVKRWDNPSNNILIKKTMSRLLNVLREKLSKKLD